MKFLDPFIQMYKSQFRLRRGKIYIIAIPTILNIFSFQVFKATIEHAPAHISDNKIIVSGSNFFTTFDEMFILTFIQIWNELDQTRGSGYE